MKKTMKILLKITGVAFLIVLTLWLISYGIGVNTYIKNTSNVPKLSTLEQEKQYVDKKEKELFRNIDIFKMVFAGGGWRARTALTLNKEIFEYFPKEANEDVDAIFHLADCYAWVGGKTNSLKAISLYQESIDVFNKKHMNETTPTDENPDIFEMRKYDFLMNRHTQIARIYLSLREYDNVINEYQKIIAEYSNKLMNSKPNLRYSVIGKAYQNMGKVYLRYYKKYNEAIKMFEKAQEIFPNPTTASINRTNIGDCYLVMGDKVRAKEIYESVYNEYKNYKGKNPVDFTSARDRLKNLKKWKTILTKYDVMLY